VVTLFEIWIRGNPRGVRDQKSSIYKWRKLLRENQSRLEVLNDKSKTPKREGQLTGIQKL
jgi:hypothetical protein